MRCHWFAQQEETKQKLKVLNNLGKRVNVHVRAKVMGASSLFPATLATSASRPERESDVTTRCENVAPFSLLFKQKLFTLYKEKHDEDNVS